MSILCDEIVQFSIKYGQIHIEYGLFLYICKKTSVGGGEQVKKSTSPQRMGGENVEKKWRANINSFCMAGRKKRISSNSIQHTDKAVSHHFRDEYLLAALTPPALFKSIPLRLCGRFFVAFAVFSWISYFDSTIIGFFASVFFFFSISVPRYPSTPRCMFILQFSIKGRFIFSQQTHTHKNAAST